MKRNPTRPDLLERFVSLGISGKAFEQKHSLPRNLIAQMRQGAYGGPKAAETIAKLVAAIETQERAGKVTIAEQARAVIAEAEARDPEAHGYGIPAPAAKVHRDVKPAVSPEARAPGRPRAFSLLTEEDLAHRAKLRDEILAAADIAAVDDCNKLVSAALLDGAITDTSARVLRELLAERRQSLEDKAEEQEKARAGETMVIEIRYVNAEWRRGES